MIINGFKINECDKCVYIKNTEKCYVIICLYVDAMLISGSNSGMINSTKKILKTTFDMKNIGVVYVILGMKITKTFERYVLSRTHYVDKILDKLNKHDDRHVKTFVDANLHLKKNKGKNISQLE